MAFCELEGLRAWFTIRYLSNMAHIFKLMELCVHRLEAYLTFTITKLMSSNNWKRHEDGNGSVRERKRSFSLCTRNIKCYITICQEQYTNMRANLSKVLNNIWKLFLLYGVVRDYSSLQESERFNHVLKCNKLQGQTRIAEWVIHCPLEQVRGYNVHNFFVGTTDDYFVDKKLSLTWGINTWEPPMASYYDSSFSICNNGSCESVTNCIHIDRGQGF